MDATPILVTAAVIVDGSRILVCQRPLHGHHPGKWEFPGGKREAGEDLPACMRRELREELGIEAEVGRVLWQTRHHYPGRAPFELTFFLIPRYRGELENRVFAQTRWVALEEMKALDFLEGDREFIDAVLSRRVQLF